MSDNVRIFELMEDGETVDAEERRLTTAEKVNAALGQTATDDAELIESIIDQVSGECARYCGLARPLTGLAVPTFGQELVRVTWRRAVCDRGTTLFLPWRVPLVSVDLLTEDGVELTEGTDFDCTGAGMLVRISDDAPICWSAAKIIAELTVGWDLPDGVPAELEGRVIDQVKMRFLARASDPRIRSEQLSDVGAVTYSVEGGDSIGDDGLLPSLKMALAAFKNPSV